MLKIVLASRSPRRKKLLSQVGLKFEIIPSEKEEIIRSTSPIEVVEELSSQKALDVAEQLNNAIVIGADTIVVYKNEILGKPTDESDVIRMLSLLSNDMHSVFTGVSIIKKMDGDIVKQYNFVEETKVTFSPLSLDEIRSYISTGSPMDKAGAYGIQDDWGAVFVKEIVGDFYNVVGFPLNRFYQLMKTEEADIFKTMETTI